MKIIKVLGLILAMGIGAQTASAQDGKFAFGPQGGLVFSDYSVRNTAVNFGNEDGFLAGLFFEMGLWTVTFRPEINYVERGFTVANTAEVTQRFLEVPLLLKVNPFGPFVVSPFIVVGPSWSHHLESNVALQGTTTAYTNTVNRNDISGVAGLGIEFNIAEHVGLSLQGRYNFGFRDLDEGTARIRSRSIYAIGGLSFQY